MHSTNPETPRRKRIMVQAALAAVVILAAQSSHAAQWRPGLLAGKLSNDWDTASPNPGTTNCLGPVAGKTVTAEKGTWVYTGQFYASNNANYVFAESFDDWAYLKIDNIIYMNDGTWSNVSATCQIWLTNGWYDLEVRFGNSSGGGGPYTNAGWNSAFGFGYNGIGTNSFNQSDYVYPEDNGTMNLFRFWDTNTAVTGIVDADGDRMPDDWETQYFSSTTALNGGATEDYDGDGTPNRDEYVAGTSPADPASRFKVSISLSGGSVQVSYPTLATSGNAYVGLTRYYDLQTTANLQTDPWMRVPDATNVPGNGLTATHADLASDPTRMYRVVVRLK